MEKKENIASQAAIARAAGCHPATVSRARAQRESVTLDHYTKFAEITGLPVEMWIRGDRRTLKRELRKFFKKEKYKTATN